jgi:hypothetical protein
MTLEPMYGGKSTLSAMRHEQDDRARKVPAWGGSQHAVNPDDGNLLGYIATILVDKNRALAR